MIDGLVPITEIVRSGRVESVHYGSAVVADASGKILAGAGNASLATYLRSAAKPVQLLAMLELGLEADSPLELEELAVCAASHGGEVAHTEVVVRLLRRFDLNEHDLRCGALPPLDPEARRQLERAGREPTAVHNNCSGKHTAMLITCATCGFPLEGYPSPSHPLQRAVRRRVEELSGRLPEEGVDGCGVPTYHLDLTAAARMAAGLMVMAEDGGAAGRVVRAMTTRPWYTSGSRRLAYRLMTEGRGLLAKEGAEGFFLIGVPRDRSRWGVPVGLAVKVIDGAGEEARGRDPGVVAALVGLGVLREEERKALEGEASTVLRNAAGSTVGVIRGVLELQERS